MQYRKQQQQQDKIVGQHIAMEGCLHEARVSNEQFKGMTVSEVYNPETASYDKYVVCPECTSDNHKPGRQDFCMKSVIHQIAASYPLVKGDYTVYQNVE